ncbi:serine/arginine-rich splicing factor 3-like [Ptychodera flava]|uniref:serine/arginine-rich splicing factor 3-like n=1 Tax=Ptychodera flava TaxID=63121 RepID=UPI003969E55F
MSHWRDTCPLDCKVYVGDLGSGAAKHELERAFSHYGPLRNVWVARNPPGFAFVEFEDPRDASDSVRALDGRIICGRRVRVELSSGKTRRGRYVGRPPPPARRSYYDDRDRDRSFDRYDRYRRSPRSRSRSPVHRRRPRRSRSPRSPRSPRSRSRSGSRGRRSNDRKRSYSRERKSREKSHSPTPEAEESRNGDDSPVREVSGDED